MEVKKLKRIDKLFFGLYSFASGLTLGAAIKCLAYHDFGGVIFFLALVFLCVYLAYDFSRR